MYQITWRNESFQNITVVFNEIDKIIVNLLVHLILRMSDFFDYVEGFAVIKIEE